MFICLYFPFALPTHKCKQEGALILQNESYAFTSQKHSYHKVKT